MYSVAYRKNDTGETRIRKYPHSEYDVDHTIWWLTEGNFGCDCNRELEWRRANGEDPDWGEVYCSDGRFSIPYIILDNGDKLEIEHGEMEKI